MRIGVYGGTFNPPHLGHMAAARAAAVALKLDRLILIPDAVPPHKPLPEGSPTAEERLELTRIAAAQAHLPCETEVSDIELRRGGMSYMADTIEALRAEVGEDAELWLLMGSDMFLTFDRWYMPERILKQAGLCAFHRVHADEDQAFESQRAKLYSLVPESRIFTMSIPELVEISSSDLRAMLKAEPERALAYIAPAELGFILRKALYATDADLKRLPLSLLRPVALSFLKEKRIPHVLGTEQEAIKLALRYGADVEKARRTALLHDMTKKLEMPEQKALCELYALPLDALEEKALKLLHAKTGAAMAADLFGVGEEIASAIRWHTTGRADMTLLEKIIYLADYIEPSRDFPGVWALRKTVYEDLDAGLLMGLEMTIAEMEEMGNPVHHATIEARDWLQEVKA